MQYLLMSLTKRVTITSIAVRLTVTIALKRSGLIKLVLKDTCNHWTLSETGSDSNRLEIEVPKPNSWWAQMKLE